MIGLFQLMSSALFGREHSPMKWWDYDLWPWKIARLVDGSDQRGGHVMRRRGPDGSWQYRRPTEEEDQLWRDVQQR